MLYHDLFSTFLQKYAIINGQGNGVRLESKGICHHLLVYADNINFLNENINGSKRGRNC
jgi:hypothetical protein